MVGRAAPGPVHTFLQFASQGLITNCTMLRHALQLRWVKAKVFDHTGVATEAYEPMDVDAVYAGKAKGKGKSFGKPGGGKPGVAGKAGKAKGKGKDGGKKGAFGTSSVPRAQVCWMCGGVGHLARQCPSTVSNTASTSVASSSTLPMSAAALATKPFMGKCRRCGRKGHKTADCRVNLGEVAPDAAEVATVS